MFIFISSSLKISVIPILLISIFFSDFINMHYWLSTMQFIFFIFLYRMRHLKLFSEVSQKLHYKSKKMVNVICSSQRESIIDTKLVPSLPPSGGGVGKDKKLKLKPLFFIALIWRPQKYLHWYDIRKKVFWLTDGAVIDKNKKW